MKTLSEFNFNELEHLLTELGSVPRIFNSEAQFQFEMAWKIKQEFDCEVKLEELSRTCKVSNSKGKTVTKKDYTDIILEKENIRIAIELKYKTAEPKGININDNILLMNHGAADLGAYDFMWDIHRIQLLTGCEKDDASEVRMPCTRGYAIILTNDNNYWKTNANNKVPEKGINRMFLIGDDEEGSTYIQAGEHEWFKLDGTPGLSKAIQNDKSRQNAIKMSKNYPYEWKEYCKPIADKNGIFRFLIVEII